ncbi:DUF1456 family protein [Eionea flava]
MTNNDILRRLRYTFDLKETKIVKLISLTGETTSRSTVNQWLKKEEHDEFLNCNDRQFATFLNGFIIDRRGQKDSEPQAAEKKLSNNLILLKLKIALKLRAEDIIELMGLAGFTISKPELSALFRKPEHKHYRECKDQFLRNFLNGLQKKYRSDDNDTSNTFQWKLPQ